MPAVDIWESSSCKRVLAVSDAAASVTSLLTAVTVLIRLRLHLPQDYAGHETFGHQQSLLTMKLACLAVTIASSVPLFLMTLRPQMYYRYRMQLSLANRLLRLLVQTLTMFARPFVGSLILAVAARSVSTCDNGLKALAIAIFHPLVFYVTAALHVLPWKWVAVLQSAATALLLGWMWQFPCILQHAAATAGIVGWPSCVTLAEQACSQVQSLAAVVATVTGDRLPVFSEHSCQDVRALQVLQVFATIVCMFGVPVVAVYELEYWLNRHLTQVQDTAAATSSRIDRINRGSGNMPDSSSSSSSQSTRQGVPGSRSSRTVVATYSANMQSDAAWNHVQLLCLLLVLGLPATWLLSEFVAGVFAKHVECTAVLRAAGMLD